MHRSLRTHRNVEISVSKNKLKKKKANTVLATCRKCEKREFCLNFLFKY